MDCIYAAYCDHLNFLGLKADRVDWLLYRAMKIASHGPLPQPTWGGAVPWIIGTLARRHGLTMTVQYRIFTPEVQVADASNPVQRWIARHTDYGEEVTFFSFFTLKPAIYLLMGGSHASFLYEVPHWNSVPVMAIQLRRLG
jgi:hypothetical protein